MCKSCAILPCVQNLTIVKRVDPFNEKEHAEGIVYSVDVWGDVKKR